MDSSHAAWLDRARAAWDERAPAWDEMSEANAAAPDRPADLQRTADALRLRPDTALLDAGCGTGQWATAFAALGCRVTGVDLVPEMIARARRHAAERDVDVTWRVADLTRLPDLDASYDAVHARASLQFVPDPAATLREFRRVLRPGGRLYASVPGALSPIYQNGWRRFVEPLASNLLTPSELDALLTELGWTVRDGWGSYGAILGGEANPFTAEQVAGLDRRLRQAAATLWSLVAD